MAPYDSDSSDGEDDYTETNVLLGYATREATEDAISHLGGQPAWLDSTQLPPGQFAKCKSCNGLLSLLLELHGDLPDRFPGHERRLYLWACRRKACQRKPGSIRGVRATRTSKAAQQAAQQSQEPTPTPPSPPQPKQNLGSSIFGANPAAGSLNANPFSTTSSPSASSNPFASGNPFASASSLAAKPPQRPQQPADDTTTSLAQTFAEKARINTDTTPTQSSPPQIQGPAEPWPATSAFPPSFPLYHLDADYEALDASPAPIPQQVQIDMDIDEPAASGSGSSKDKDGDKELYESTMDKAFQKFADRVAQNPDQVLRYEFAGQPLLYSRDDIVGKALDQGKNGRIPRCTNCGAERTFELQLMPNAITELEAEDMGVEGMEWGTVIFAVCSKDCSSAGATESTVSYIEEWVGVQWEEVVHRRN